MPNHTCTRRDFLKATGLSTVGLAVSGCSEPVRAPMVPTSQAEPKQGQAAGRPVDQEDFGADGPGSYVAE